MASHTIKLLLELDRVANSSPLRAVNLHVLSAGAKMPHLGVGLHAATLLEAQGLAMVSRSSVLEDNCLQITSAGVAAAHHRRLPFWKRWLSDTTLVRPLLASVIGGTIVAVVNQVVRFLSH